MCDSTPMGRGRTMKWKKVLYDTIEGLISWLPNENVTIHRELVSIQQDILEPPMLLVAGEFNAGKSTFINALLGKEVLTSDIIPATAVVTKLTYGEEEEVIGHFVDGHSQHFRRSELEQLTAERGGDWESTRQRVSYIELKLPEKRLKNLTIVDSPGLNSGYKWHTSATIDFMNRADEVIWLFNYQNLGTQSELSQLKKIREMGLMPYGVVNRIDLHNDEEESLEEFLEGSFGRVSGLVKGLIGVSASEALEGKLESNSEMLNWSNWDAIEPVILDVEKAVEGQCNRLFTRLAKSLKEIHKMFVYKNKKFMDFPHRYSLKTFIENELPMLLQDKESLEPAYKELQFLQSHFTNSPDRLFSLKKVNSWIEEYQKRKGETEAIQFWKVDIFPLYELFNKEARSYNNALEEAYPEFEQLEKEWEDFEVPILFGKKKLQAKIKENEIYQKKIDSLTLRYEDLTVMRRTLRGKLKELNSLLQAEIEPVYRDLGEELYQQINKWNASYLRRRREFKDVEDQFLDDVKVFVQDLLRYSNIINPLFSMNQRELERLDSYQKCNYIFNKTGSYLNLYPNVNEIEAFNGYREMGTLINVSTKSNPKVQVPSIRLTEINKPPELKVKVESYYKTIHLIRWGYSILAIVASIMILMAIFNNSDEPTKEVSGKEIELAVTDVYDPSEDEPEEDERPAVKNLSFEERWSEKDVGEYYKDMMDDIDDSLLTTVNFSNRWFSREGVDDYRLYYDEFSSGNMEDYEIKGYDFSEKDVLLTTSEMYYINDTAYTFNVKYVIGAFGNVLEITGVTYETIEVDEPQIMIEEEDLAQFIRDFRRDYMNALNQDAFSYIAPYLIDSGPAYEELKEYMNSISSKGYQFDFLKDQVVSLEEIDKNLYRITTNEEFIFRNDSGEETLYDKTKEYQVQVVSENSLYIEEIINLETNTEKVAKPTEEDV